MNVFLNSLQAPPGVVADMTSAQRNRKLFRGNKCTSCRNVDHSKRVLLFAVPMTMIVPGDNPLTYPG